MYSFGGEVGRFVGRVWEREGLGRGEPSLLLGNGEPSWEVAGLGFICIYMYILCIHMYKYI